MMRARDNPFATEHVLRLRYQFRKPGGDGWPVLLARLESLRYRAAIVGPHGSGKTTLLEDLGRKLRDRGFRIHPVFLNEQDRDYPVDFIRRVQPGLSAEDVILLDGCEQLSLANWYRFRWQMRRAGGLIITTHRPGRLPVLRLCETDPELLDDLVRRLCNDPSLPVTMDMRRLYESHHGNLRDALRALYDLAADSQSSATAMFSSPDFSPRKTRKSTE
jgi:hypothetical protein